MKPSEDFLLLILHAYILTAAEVCQVESDTCHTLAKKIVQHYIKITLPGDQSIPAVTNDKLFNYTCDLFGMSLLWHGFHDAIKEGDGERIFTYWKFLTVIFQQNGHYNYAKEGLWLTVHSQVLCERVVEEMKWCRTINTIGRPGHNIPCDLHMEHLNRRLKIMMCNVNLGVNKFQGRIAKSLGVVHKICSRFSDESGVPTSKGHHTLPSFGKDLEMVMRELQSEEVFSVKDGRHLTSFMKPPLLKTMKWNNIKDWVKNKLQEFDFSNV